MMVIHRAESDDDKLNVSRNDRAESVKRSSRMLSMSTVEGEARQKKTYVQKSAS